MDTVKETLKTWATPAITLGLIALLVAPMYGKFDDINARLDTFSGRLDTFSGRLDTFSGRLDTFSGRLDTLNERLDSTRIELKNEINAVRIELKGEIHALGARIDSTRDGLDRRMEAPPARLEALNLRVDAVERGDAPKGAQGGDTPGQGASPR
ncbi:MAG: hypothetical protein OXH50_06560 [Gemmatimonadetes bacterium]|nr:hypothetical protein [Gemmatimonadota bacterium]